MECKVIWSEAALADLHDLCAYIAQDNPAAALRMGGRLLEQIGLLTSAPLLGPLYDGGTDVSLRILVCRPYRIFYQVNEGQHTVEILHLWHGAREEPKF